VNVFEKSLKVVEELLNIVTQEYSTCIKSLKNYIKQYHDIIVNLLSKMYEIHNHYVDSSVIARDYGLRKFKYLDITLKGILSYRLRCEEKEVKANVIDFDGSRYEYVITLYTFYSEDHRYSIVDKFKYYCNLDKLNDVDILCSNIKTISFLALNMDNIIDYLRIRTELWKQKSQKFRETISKVLESKTEEFRKAASRVEAFLEEIKGGSSE